MKKLISIAEIGLTVTSYAPTTAPQRDEIANILRGNHD